MKKQFLFFPLLFAALFSLHPLGGKDEPEPESPPEEAPSTIQDLYTALDPALPVIGFLELELGENIPYEAGRRIWDDFLYQLVLDGVYKPAGFNQWFSEEYAHDPPTDIIEILYDVKKQKLPMASLGVMKISRCSDGFMVQIGIHDLKNRSDTRYLYRIVDNLEEAWDFIFPDLMNEFYFRMEKKADPLLDKKIFIESLKVRYYQYYELQTGEYAFTEIPFMTLDGVDFREDNDILGDILGMKLHLSGLFPVLFSDFDSQVKDLFRRRPGCYWGIRGEMRIADRMSVFRMEIYDYRRQTVTARYDIPFRGYDMETLFSVADLAVPFVLEQILSDTEKRRVCYVSPEIDMPADRVYNSQGCLGPAELTETYIMSPGLNNLLFVEDTDTPIYPRHWRQLVKEDPEWQPEVETTLVIPELSAFNVALLVDPSGEHYRIYTEKDILYAEQLFLE